MDTNKVLIKESNNSDPKANINDIKQTKDSTSSTIIWLKDLLRCLFKNWGFLVLIIPVIINYLVLNIEQIPFKLFPLNIQTNTILLITWISCVLMILFTFNKPNIFSAKYRKDYFKKKIAKTFYISLTLLIIYILFTLLPFIKDFYYLLIGLGDLDKDHFIGNLIITASFIVSIVTLIRGFFLLAIKDYYYQTKSMSNTKNILSDQSIMGAFEDLLDYKQTVDNLEDFICKCKPPMTIGVYGAWGSGKTSFMRLTEECLKNDMDDGIIKTVWFDAWKYDKMNDVRVALINNILGTMSNDKDITGVLRSKIKKLSKNIDLYGLGKKTLSHGISVLPPPFSTVGKFLSENLFRKPSEGKTATVIRDFEGEFKNIVDEFVGDEGRLVVFIDDLDRCDPDKTIEILESIKVFLTNSKSIFVIGADRNVVTDILKKRYEDKSSDWWNKYLDKIIQVEFSMPTFSPELVESFISNAQLKISDEVRKHASILCKVGDNPRTIKKMLNNIELQRSFKQDDLENNISMDKLAKFNVLYYRWNESFRFIIEKFDKNEKFFDNLKEINTPDETDKINKAERYNLPELIYRNEEFLNFFHSVEPLLSKDDFESFKYLRTTMKLISPIKEDDVDIKKNDKIENFTRQIRLNPNNPNLYNDRGGEYLNKLEYHKAIEDFNQAIKLDEKFFIGYYNLGIVYTNINEIDIAIKQYEKAIELNDRYINAFYNLALLFDRIKNYDKSIENYKKVIEIGPVYYSDYFNLALAYQNNNQLKEAIDNYSESIKINNNYDTAFYNRGVAYDKAGKSDEAIKDYTEAIKINPNYADSFNNRGVVYYNKYELDKAILDYDTAIKLNPNYSLAYNNRGLVYDKKIEWDKAIMDFTEAIRINPDYSTAYYSRGLVYNKKKEWDEAIKNYTEAIRINPKYFDAYNNRGVAYFNKGELDKAVLDYTEALKINPGYHLAHNNLGLIYEQTEEWDKAVSEYTEAINIKHDYDSAYFSRGLVHERKGELDKAVEDYTEAIKFNSKNMDAYINRGVLYYNRGELEKAILDYTEAIKLDPGYLETYYNRALAYEKNKQIDEAILDYTEVIKINPDHLDALIGRGNAFDKKEDFQEAINDYNSALNLQSEEGLIYYNRGVTKIKQNKPIEAMEDFSNALKYKNGATRPVDYAWRSIANAYLNNIDEALVDLKEANRNNAEINYYISAAYSVLFEKKGNLDYKKSSLQHLKLALDNKEVDKVSALKDICFRSCNKDPEFIALVGNDK